MSILPLFLEDIFARYRILGQSFISTFKNCCSTSFWLHGFPSRKFIIVLWLILGFLLFSFQSFIMTYLGLDFCFIIANLSCLWLTKLLFLPLFCYCFSGDLTQGALLLSYTPSPFFTELLDMEVYIFFQTNIKFILVISILILNLSCGF